MGRMTRMQLWNWVKVMKMVKMMMRNEDARDSLDKRREDIDTGSVRLTMLRRDCVQFQTALWQPENIQH